MDTSYYIVNQISTANFSANTYYQIFVKAGGNLIYKGLGFPAPVADIVLNLTVNSEQDVAGTNNKDIILLGKKKPQAFAEGPPGQGGVNTDGTWNIRG
jgi:hypothetical protein